MARKTIFVSDLTGKTIDEKDAAIVTIRYSDARKGQVVLDVNASEVEDLARKGRSRSGAVGDRTSKRFRVGRDRSKLSVPRPLALSVPRNESAVVDVARSARTPKRATRRRLWCSHEDHDGR